MKNIKKLQPRSEVAVLRRFSKDGLPEDLKNLVGYVFMKPADALKWKPDVVFVTNPAPFHVSAAMRFAKRGSHLFIEKPLSISLKDIGPLLNLCHKRELVVMVGYCLRFLLSFERQNPFVLTTLKFGSKPSAEFPITER